MMAFALSGCGGEEASPGSQVSDSKTAPPEPVTLQLYAQQKFTPKDFELLIANPVKQKYPNITVELIETNKNPLENVVATGQQVDLITEWHGLMPSLKEIGLFEDIVPLAKKHNLDLNRFDPQALGAIKTISDKGELYGLPYNVQLNALYYNKDIFDKFGVSYPADGMTWDDAIGLAQKVSRTDGSIQYRGLDPESVLRLMFPLSLTLVDGKTNKSVVNSAPYQKLFELGKRIYDIPGNKPDKMNKNSLDAFVKDKNVAMLASYNIFDQLKMAGDLNWDVAQYPSYPENPNTYGMYDLHVMLISKTSKHKDEAMKVMETLLSNEVQLASVRSTLRVSALKDLQFQQAFGADVPALNNKKLSSIFKSHPALCPPFSIYYNKVRTPFRTRFADYVNGKTDLNTALRLADEDLTKLIEQ
jgi:multiple sugar transport system substrate-binding protein